LHLSSKKEYDPCSLCVVDEVIFEHPRGLFTGKALATERFTCTRADSQSEPGMSGKSAHCRETPLIPYKNTASAWHGITNSQLRGENTHETRLYVDL